MDLGKDVLEGLGLDADLTAAGLGTLLFAVRVGLDARTWEQIKEVMPDAPALLGRASTTGGRTAEIVSLTMPGAVRRNLAALGVREPAVQALADALRRVLRANLAPDAAARAEHALDRALA